MSDNKYSPIKLQLEEAIWLDHRAQNAEIISLELIPDVDIVEDDYFVNIRGHLVLIGKYETEEEEESLDLESSSLAQQLQFDPLHVEPKEIYEQEYRGKIEHRFPFDVTVPANKVRNLDDVYVHVEQFDYTISDGHRLQIKTEIMITGIENEVQSKPALKQNEEKQEKQELNIDIQQQEKIKSADKPETKVWSDFLPVRNKEAQEETEETAREEQQEVRKELAKASQGNHEVKSIASKEDKARIEKKERPEAQQEQEQAVERKEPAAEQQEQAVKRKEPAAEQQEQAVERKEPAAEQQEQTIEKKEAAKEENEEVLAQKRVEGEQAKQAEESVAEQTEEGRVEENIASPLDKAEENIVPLFPQEIKTTFSSRPEVNETDAVAPAAEEEKPKEDEQIIREEQASKTVSFLTKLMEFGEEGTEETQKSKLRMCIIQQNESLEDISERYSISVYELMKANNLETDQISRGQILYIPKS